MTQNFNWQIFICALGYYADLLFKSLTPPEKNKNKKVKLLVRTVSTFLKKHDLFIAHTQARVAFNPQ